LNLPTPEALQALAHLRRSEALGRYDGSTDFPRLPFHEIVCISGLWVGSGDIKLFSFCQQDYSEREIITRFLGVFDKHFPMLVSWNGKGFDVPVLLYRAMIHQISAPRFFDQGEHDTTRRYDNYQNRYHARHTDLMDAMALFNTRSFQRLDDIAQLFGFPGKQGVSGADVSTQVQAGQWDQLKEYCEGDVLNTWLVYLRWLLLRGQLDTHDHDEWVQQTRDFLTVHPVHQLGFLKNWA
jgi:3'-5' exonuclease